MSETTHNSSNISDFPTFEPLMAIISRIANGERVPPQITMRYEMLRFCTLRSFPRENKPFITRIAQAGFYYASSEDEVICYCCARRKRNWREDDIPINVHRELSPNCKFLLKNAEVNVPIMNRSQEVDTVRPAPEPSSRSQSGRHFDGGADSIAQIGDLTFLQTSNTKHRDLPAQSSSGQTEGNTDTSREGHPPDNGFSTLIVASGITRRNHPFTANPRDRPNSGPDHISISRNSGEGSPSTMPKYPKYASQTVRLASFNDCREIVITPEHLSQAGFFYAGFGDCVRCFQCGVGLRHWSEEDDPWIEHSRWSKDCSYVLLKRGAEFIHIVQLALEYAQNQNVSSQMSSQNNVSGAAGQNLSTAADEISRLMHTDSAQSVLEMGYHPDIIRRAIREVLDTKGRQGLNAANIMETVLDIEDSENPQSSEPNDSGTNSNENHEPGELLTSPSTSEQIGAMNAISEDRNDERPVNNGSKIEYDERPAVGGSEIGNDVRPGESELKKTRSEARGTAGAVSKEQNDITSQVRSNDTSRETKNDKRGENKVAGQGQEPDLSVASSNKSSTLLSAVIGATGGGKSANHKAKLLEQKRLKEENEILKQQNICSQCKKKDVCIVFLPCGHLITCEECAPSVKRCTVSTCGRYIKGTVRTYLS